MLIEQKYYFLVSSLNPPAGSVYWFANYGANITQLTTESFMYGGFPINVNVQRAEVRVTCQGVLADPGDLSEIYLVKNSTEDTLISQFQLSDRTNISREDVDVDINTTDHFGFRIDFSPSWVTNPTGTLLYTVTLWMETGLNRALQMFRMPHDFGNLNFIDSNTYRIGSNQSNAISSSGTSLHPWVFPSACNIVAARLDTRIIVTLGSSENVEIDLVKNGSTSTNIITDQWTARQQNQIAALDSISIASTPSDYWEYDIRTPAWVINPTQTGTVLTIVTELT